MRKRIACVLAAWIVISAPKVIAHVSTGTIAGTVFERNGTPAAGAEVMIERADGSAPVAARTNSQGKFTFKFVRGGLYDIRASRGNSSTPWRHNVLVHAGRLNTIELRLEPIRAKSPK